MKINKLLKELKKIRNEYGNVEIALFDGVAWENGAETDWMPLEYIRFYIDDKRVVLY